jgi:hypothetical protein
MPSTLLYFFAAFAALASLTVKAAFPSPIYGVNLGSWYTQVYGDPSFAYVALAGLFSSLGCSPKVRLSLTFVYF